MNRLCTQIADRYGWGFANINLRSYYAEGAKTMGFEIAEQLGWRYPDHIVSPVAGGTLLPRIYKGLREFKEVGLVGRHSCRRSTRRSRRARRRSIRALEAGLEFPDPVKPNTIAKSLAIGNPADGFQVVKVVKETGGSGAMVSDEEILDAIQLLASTEGIFTEPAGGTTLAATRALIKRGVIKPNESVVICITGNGYKTAEVMRDRVAAPIADRPQPGGLRAGGRRRSGAQRQATAQQGGDHVSRLPEADGRRGAWSSAAGRWPRASSTACWRRARRSRWWRRTIRPEIERAGRDASSAGRSSRAIWTARGGWWRRRRPR